MTPSKEYVEDFKRLYQESTGEQLTDKEAMVLATEILSLYWLLSRPLPGETSQN